MNANVRRRVQAFGGASSSAMHKTERWRGEGREESEKEGMKDWEERWREGREGKEKQGARLGNEGGERVKGWRE